jgi:hypothetical protein
VALDPESLITMPTSVYLSAGRLENVDKPNDERSQHIVGSS